MLFNNLATRFGLGFIKSFLATLNLSGQLSRFCTTCFSQTAWHSVCSQVFNPDLQPRIRG